jgi:hypothetical protein
MTKKYEVHNQLTGLSEEAITWEEAKQLHSRLRAEYIADRVDPLFQISVLVQNDRGAWTQSISDENGNPLVLSVSSNEPEPEPESSSDGIPVTEV